MLSIGDSTCCLFTPFVNPGDESRVGVDNVSKRLGSRRRFSLNFANLVVLKDPTFRLKVVECEDDDEPVPVIVLWPIPEPVMMSDEVVVVDSMFAKVLREHQVIGVQFIFRSLMGLHGLPDSHGCILADDMGLGKTLQSICIVWTLLNSNINGLKTPAVRRALILCPASLVKNWASEFAKWTHGKCPTVAIGESTKDKVIGQFTQFIYADATKVLICSYETYRLHHRRLRSCPVDLIVCDEAHRLKNDRAKITACIVAHPARYRLLLTGTPIQNDMTEFFSMIALAMPSMGVDTFNKRFSFPITRGRDPEATSKERQAGETALRALSELSCMFILRRTNALLTKFLPARRTLIMFCPLTPTQRAVYVSVCDWLLGEMSSGVHEQKGAICLKVASTLMKICCHPSMISHLNFWKLEKDPLSGNTKSAPKSSSIDFALSGKLTVLRDLLCSFQGVRDKCVVVSSFTSSLDVVGILCDSIKVPYLRLDGKVDTQRRHTIVTEFNQALFGPSVFLLSSKAGGCGINLIGANRLVMLDADWNPANDKQAMARIWREGQQKTCWIYRLFCTGTIEERVLQRQINKDSLSSAVIGCGVQSLTEGIARSELRKLFSLGPAADVSETHRLMCSGTCRGSPSSDPTLYSEVDLRTWDHIQDLSKLAQPCSFLEEGCLAQSVPLISMLMHFYIAG